MRKTPIILGIATVIAAAICWWSYHNGYSAAVREVDASWTATGLERRLRPERDTKDKVEALSRLLERPWTFRTSNEAWTLVRGLPESQVKEMIEGIESTLGTTMGRSQFAVLSMLYHRWAQIDPVEAIEKASGSEDKEQPGNFSGSALTAMRGNFARSALTAWMKQDAGGAFRWMEANPQLKFSGHHYMMANLLFTRPAAEALDLARTYSPEVYRLARSGQASKMSTSEEDRAAMLALVEDRSKDREEQVEVARQLAEAWGLADPVAALAGLGSLGLLEVEKGETKEAIVASWAETDPRAAFSWAVSEAGSQPVDKQAAFYLRWENSDSVAALAELGVADSRSPGLIKGVMGSLLARADRRTWGGVGARLGTESPELVRLQDHYAAWARQSPAEAEQWRESLSPDDRSKIDPPEAADEVR